MSLFDEDRIISEQFLIEQGFKKYRTGYYDRYQYQYIRDKFDPEHVERSVRRVFFSIKNNNLYIEKSMDWDLCGYYWKHKVQDHLDFLSIILRYELEEEI